MKVKQKDIAARAGVSVMTVSLALRGSAEVSSGTCQRIRSIAEEMGYAPNPLVSALMRTRRGRGRVESGLAIAWHGAETALRKRDRGQPNFCDTYKEMLEGAREGCRRNGFALELFLFHETGSELPRVLKARGIRGLVLGPIGPDNVRGFSMEQLDGLHLLRVAPTDSDDGADMVERNFFGEMRMCVNALADAGCQRIGFIDYHGHQEQSGGRWKGAFLTADREGIALCPPDLHRIRFEDPLKWLDAYVRRERPDGIVAGGRIFIQALIDRSDAGRHIPFACLERNAWPEWVSGVETDFQQIGEDSVQLLINRILSPFSRGNSRRTTTVHSTWHEGSSHCKGQNSIFSRRNRLSLL